MGTDALGTKEPLRKCRYCGLEARTEEELEGFAVRKDRPTKTKNYCKSCDSKSSLAYYKKNPLQRKALHVKTKYGITLEQYNEQMSTSACCQICSSTARLSYDHCHTTNDFRGVLCGKCNTGIGMLGDTYESVKKALDYLEDRCYTNSMTSEEKTDD